MGKKTVVFDSVFWIGFILVVIAALQESRILGFIGLGLQVISLVSEAFVFRPSFAEKEPKPAAKQTQEKSVGKTVAPPSAQKPPKKPFFSLFHKAKAPEKEKARPLPQPKKQAEQKQPRQSLLSRIFSRHTQAKGKKEAKKKEPEKPVKIPKKKHVDRTRILVFILLVLILAVLVIWQSVNIADGTITQYIFLGINILVLLVMFASAKKVLKKQKSDDEREAERLALQQEIEEAKEQGKELPLEKRLDLLKHHIRRFINLNYTKSQIVASALKAGWPEDLIEQAYNTETAEPSGVELVIKRYELNILRTYMKKAIDEHYADDVIIEAALKAGWPEKIVRECYDSIQGKEYVLGREEEMFGPEEQKQQQVLKVTAKLIKHETDLDRVYNLIKEKRAVKLSDIASQFNINKKHAEDWAAILEKHGLIEIYYPMLGEPELRWKKSTATA